MTTTFFIEPPFPQIPPPKWNLVMAHCIHFMVAITTFYFHRLEDCKAIMWISAVASGLNSGWTNHWDYWAFQQTSNHGNKLGETQCHWVRHWFTHHRKHKLGCTSTVHATGLATGSPWKHKLGSNSTVPLGSPLVHHGNTS